MKPFALFFAGILLVAAGCGKGNIGDKMVAEGNDANVKRLANLYYFHQLKNNFEGPADEAAFKSFINSLDDERLKMAGVEKAEVDNLFVSERDSQPFKIRYGLLSKVRGPSLPVVFEETGVSGMRQVGFTNSAMQEVDQAEYDRLWASEVDEDAEVDIGRGG